ncbi:MAG TPA: phosphate ABC transporter substrate-binding protein [Lachnospiraceae bacterium]|nr:phosphate ABC transporter substrate-binding protein [Lachnospiraceae bacterium]
MKNVKKYLALAISGAAMVSALAGCGGTGSSSTSDAHASGQGVESATAGQDTGSAADGGFGDFDIAKEIGVLTREDGSGTRGAFIELFGIEQENEAGEKVDNTTETAAVTNSTSVMMTTVAGDPYAIGYISLGSMNDTVKAVSIDGVDATAGNIENDTYKIARPFNIATKEGLSDAAQDFIDFIMSADGQAVIEENGYIAVSDAEAYSGKMDTGKIVVAGSSSVTPVMEKLKEAYTAKNSGVTIEIQQSDSSTGMADAIDGTCDIGMASRELKDSETEKGLTATVIAMDGIAVIVNNDCPLNGLTSDQVKDIFTGNTVNWSDVLQ